MDKYEVLDQEVYDSGIKVCDYPLEVCEAFCVKLGKEKYICINSNKDFCKVKRYWLVQHELEHLNNNALYTAGSSKAKIRRAEMKANDALIRKLHLDVQVVECLKCGLDKWEICQELEILPELCDHIFNYIVRKGLLTDPKIGKEGNQDASL